MSKKLTEADIEYIRQAKTHNIPNSQIAKTLGCTIRSVQKYARILNDELFGSSQDTPTQEICDPDQQDTLTRLREARDILRMQMLVADPRNVAGIVKEYRAACEDVEKLESEEGERIREEQANAKDPLAKALQALRA